MPMAKLKFITEFPIRASKKILFPYISTASGLSQWFADDVNINEDKVYNFIWDNEDHPAKITSIRPLHHVRFEFLPNGNPEDEEDPAYFELRMDVSELTESLYLRVLDYTESDDEEELQDLWEGLVHSLKEIIGG
jgi:uncharacterized protein YndB with AHSA1/START domain